MNEQLLERLWQEETARWRKQRGALPPIVGDVIADVIYEGYLREKTADDATPTPYAVYLWCKNRSYREPEIVTI